MSETPDTPETPTATVSVVGVAFRPTGGVYQYDAGNLPLRVGDRVVVQMARGTGLATVTAAPHAVDARVAGGLPRVVKRADHRELSREEANLRRAAEAQRICSHRVRERGMAMRLIKTECTYDASKMVFYFFAEDRVDFRDLVRDLAQTLHTRIEMKQIGHRDETKLIGGMGPCGRELCCSSWLKEFSSVSVKMAKEQGLSLNPSKLAGMCGRLKCCLRYEYETYLALGRALPAVGKTVESTKGNGVVVRQNLLKQTVMIRVDEETVVEAFLEDLVARKAE
ncbi:MAG: regulatory iron-sulfur-containing complex subunit RicT [Deltaproteobacteria bacterium]|nr:regulatory iron-sulfur-containing complex subunit RicT [Deltaproteobacteria bacterium]